MQRKARAHWRERLLTDSIPEPNTGCVLWLGAARPPAGHGQIRVNRKAEYAHRMAWIAVHGPIPEGMHVLHKCDTPSCVNVDHLRLGTNRENVDDRVTRGRQNRADTHGRRKLSAADVRQMRERHAAGATRRELSAEFGVVLQNVGKIVTGKIWRSI